MEKFMLNGVEFNNFGSNNYSNGMECITAYPMPENMVQRVLNGEFHGVWLNPSADCSNDNEFYGVFGTPEQYYGNGREEGFYKRQKAAQIAKRYFQIIGGYNTHVDKEESEAANAQAEAEYKDWWLK